jgi:hypothetical protein
LALPSAEDQSKGAKLVRIWAENGIKNLSC